MELPPLHAEELVLQRPMEPLADSRSSAASGPACSGAPPAAPPGRARTDAPAGGRRTPARCPSALARARSPPARRPAARAHATGPPPSSGSSTSTASPRLRSSARRRTSEHTPDPPTSAFRRSRYPNSRGSRDTGPPRAAPDPPLALVAREEPLHPLRERAAGLGFPPLKLAQSLVVTSGCRSGCGNVFYGRRACVSGALRGTGGAQKCCRASPPSTVV